MRRLMRIMMTTRSIPIDPTISHGGHRVFITEATKNLQKLLDGKSKKEREADEACEKALEAAESLKEGAKEVKETCEFVRDKAESTSKTVTNATIEVTEKVTEATEAVKDKIKEPIEGLVSDAWGAATKKIQDKMVEKIRVRVLGEAAHEEVKDILEKAKKS